MRKTLLIFILLFCLIPISVFGFDMMVNYPRFQVFDDDGDPLSGGKIHTYDAGTTNPKTTYSDRSLSIPHTNPIILDSRGECTAGIFCTGLLKIVITDSEDVILTNGTFDDIKMTDTRTLKDNDNDTYVTVENTADEDIIRFYTESASRGLIDSGGLTLASGASVNEFSTDGAMAGNSDDAVPTEAAIVTYVDPMRIGFVQRPQYSYKDIDEIYINPATYYHDGTTDQLVYWDSQITFQFGSGGSNAASDDLVSNSIFYIYIDDSAIVTADTPVLTASEFLCDTTGPTWSDSRRAWYNGLDRCIFAVLTAVAAAEVSNFYHNGGELVLYDLADTDLSLSDIDTTWFDVTLRIPSFSHQAIVNLFDDYVDTPNAARWRTNGSSAGGNKVTDIDGIDAVSTFIVSTDTSKIIEVQHENAGGDRMSLTTQGYYLPAGM